MDSILSRQTISCLYRFALLLNGNPDSAGQVLLSVCQEFASHIGQFRTEGHRTAFLVNKIRERSSTPEGNGGNEGNGTGRFARLSQPAGTALALFYLDLFPVKELAALLKVDIEELAGLVQTAREQLGCELPPLDLEASMANKLGRLLPLLPLAPLRDGEASTEPRISKACRQVEKEPGLKQRIDSQRAFDAQWLQRIGAAELPEALLEKLAEAESSIPKKLGMSVLKQPALLPVGIALLVVLGVILYFTQKRITRFDGQENVMELLEATQEMSGVELEPKATKLGLLGDWLFSKYGFENFKVPAELADFQTEGCRVFKHNGKSVAQIAIEPNHLLFFQFQPKAFGIKLRVRDNWRTWEQGEWAGALRVHEGSCILLAMQGDQQEIEAILAKLRTKLPAKQ